nr:hypothetical protein [uncultured Gammaproteobacteria bacterium]
MRQKSLHIRIIPCKAIFAAFAILAFSFYSLAAPGVVRWKGGVSDKWSNKSNWYPARLPLQNETALFNGDARRGCSLDINDTVGSIKFSRSFHDSFSFNGNRLSVAGALADFRSSGMLSDSADSGTLAFIGASTHSLFPPDRPAYAFSRLLILGSGMVSISQNGLSVDTLKFAGGKLILGNQLSHSVHSALIVVAGSIDFASSSLIFRGARIDFSGLDSLRLGSGSLQLAGIAPQTIMVNSLTTPDIPRLVQASAFVSVIAKRQQNSSAEGVVSAGSVVLDTLEIAKGVFSVSEQQNHKPALHINTVISPLPVRILRQKDTILLADKNGSKPVPDSLVSSGAYSLLAADTSRPSILTFTNHSQTKPTHPTDGPKAVSIDTPANHSTVLSLEPVKKQSAGTARNSSARVPASPDTHGIAMADDTTHASFFAENKLWADSLPDTLLNDCKEFGDSAPGISLLSALAGDRSVLLRWSRYAQISFEKYYVFMDTATTLSLCVDSFARSIDTTAVIMGLTNGIKYHFSIGVVDSCCTAGIASNMLRATPNPSPLQIRPVGIDFGIVQTVQQKDTLVSFSNRGSNSLRVILPAGRAFSFRSNSLQIAPGKTVFDPLFFRPQLPGYDSAALLISGDSLRIPDTLHVSGFGKYVRPAIRPDTLFLFSAVPHRPAYAVVTRANNGTDSQSVSALIVDRISGDSGVKAFSIGQLRGLAAGDSIQDTVQFLPSRFGRDTALLVFSYAASGLRDTILLIGECLERTRVTQRSSEPSEFFFTAILLSDQTVQFRYGLPLFCRVRLEICNAIGQAIELPIFGLKDAEVHFMEWKASSLSKGVYFCRFKALDAVSGAVKFSKTTRLIF